MEEFRDLLIVTNNPLVRSRYQNLYPVAYLNAPLRSVLVRVRDLVYLGYELYTHPLMGSIKPNETPYKTVGISQAQKEFSHDQACIMADALLLLDRLPQKRRTADEDILSDYRLIDYTLFASAVGLGRETSMILEAQAMR